MDLDQHALRKFLAVVEELNFNRAAQRLHVSQPALSQAIRRLEANLGRDLFERGSNGTSLTEFGKTFYAIARTLVTQHDRAVALALETARGVARSFRLGYSAFTDLTIVCGARSEFANITADGHLQIYGLSDAEQVARLVIGKLDAALLTAPMPAQTLKMETLRRESLITGVRSDHRLARQKEIWLKEMSNEPLIWWPRKFNPVLSDRFFAAFDNTGTAPQIAHEATTLPEFLELVAQGFGIAFLPRSGASFSHADVVFKELAGERPVVDTVVAYRPDDHSQILKRFVSFLKEQFRRDP